MSNWQPIETAPKDGTWIELWREPQPIDGATWSPLIIARWHTFDDGDQAWVWPDDIFEVWTQHRREHADSMIDVGDCYEATGDFTHWQPLPEPPEPTP